VKIFPQSLFSKSERDLHVEILYELRRETNPTKMDVIFWAREIYFENMVMISFWQILSACFNTTFEFYAAPPLSLYIAIMKNYGDFRA
jgi:hypothetical protein